MRQPTFIGPVQAGSNQDLPVERELMLLKWNLVADLHLVKKPIRIALQNFCQVDANIAGRLAKSIHNSAQGGFVDTQHASQTVLPNAGCVHPQLQVGIDVSIQGQSMLSLISGCSILWGAEEAVTVKSNRQFNCQKESCYLSTYC